MVVLLSSLSAFDGVRGHISRYCLFQILESVAVSGGSSSNIPPGPGYHQIQDNRTISSTGAKLFKAQERE